MSRWTRWSEAEAVFTEDVRDKKRTAHSASKKVRQGGRIKTPYDLLQGKAKRQYMQNGKVRRMMQIPDTYPEFKALLPDHQREIIAYILKREDEEKGFRKNVCKQWEVQPGIITILAQGMGIIPKKDRKQYEKKVVEPQQQEMQKEAAPQAEENATLHPEHLRALESKIDQISHVMLSFIALIEQWMQKQEATATTQIVQAPAMDITEQNAAFAAELLARMQNRLMR